MSFDDQDTNAPDQSAAKSKVMVPAILLIVVAILNLLGGAYYTFSGVQVLLIPPEELARAEAQMSAEQKKQMEEAKKAGFDMQSIMKGAGGSVIALGIINLLGGLVTLFGGIKMMSLQSYGLAMTASVLAALPCISLSGCCALGEVAGIWGIIVLLSQDVKRAFR